VYPYYEKIFPQAREWHGKKQHSSEQWTEIRDYKRKHQKNNMSIWPASPSVKGASKLMSWFSPTFSGALVNATVLTLLLKSFDEKKNVSVTAFWLTLPDFCVFILRSFAIFSFWWLGQFFLPKNLITWLYFSENMTLYDQTKMTELKHATTVQRSITNENRHKIWYTHSLLAHRRRSATQENCCISPSSYKVPKLKWPCAKKNRPMQALIVQAVIGKRAGLMW